MNNLSIKVTKLAWKKMHNILSKSNNNYGFLFSASSGGCNGFNYKLGLLDYITYNCLNKTRFVTILNENNVNLYIDPISEMHLFGTTIDYVQEDINNGIFENKFIYKVDKTIATTCGCGTSFTPKKFKK